MHFYYIIVFESIIYHLEVLNMSQNYTQYNSDKVFELLNEDDPSDAIEFLKNPESFRAFNQGLSEIMIKKGYVSENATHYDMAQILSKKLAGIGSSLSTHTIDSWFKGEHRPKIEAGYRKQIYEICFALNLSLDETKWFFNHVFYDRAFNCHTIDESVFYFCIKNNLSYMEARNIIEEINDSPALSSSSKKIPNYTSYVQQELNDTNSSAELISFLSLNKENFKSWNESAYAKLDELVKLLLPTKKGKEEIDKLKTKIKKSNTFYGAIPKLKDQKEWGLIMKEFFYDFNDIANLEILNGKNICSKNFLLEQILGMKLNTTKDNRFIDKTSIPDIVKNNFPSRKTMSDVLSEEKILQSKSYDSIRKLIVLFEFYRYWCEIKINIDIESTFDLYDIFLDEINQKLFECGYEDLYAGNPYDWIILNSAQAEDPLSYFRQIISYILDVI